MTPNTKRTATVPPDEDERLERLRSFEILDTPSEPGFDNLTALASNVLDVPIALISLVDEDRLWFKSNHGLGSRNVARDDSLCEQVVRRQKLVCVSDTLEHETACNHPAVHEKDLRAYLGAPLETDDGYVIGTFCVLDSEPRDFDSTAKDFVRRMSETVMEKLELRQTKRLLEQRKDEYELAEDFADIGHWRINPQTGAVHWSDEVYRITGFDPDESPPDLAEALKLYPDTERTRIRKAIEEAVEKQEGFKIRTRITDLSDNTHHVRIQGQPHPNSRGNVKEIFGVIKDVTKEVEYQREIHRKEKRGSIGELAASIMHEINNPNGAIQGNLKYLERLNEKLNDQRLDPEEAVTTLREELPEILESLRRSTEKIDHLSDEVALLKKNTPSSGGRLSISRALNIVEERVEERLDTNEVPIEVNYRLDPDNTSQLSISLIEWNSIVSNALDNAISAARESKEPQVELSVNESDEKLKLIVVNNGKGIPEDQKSRVTDPFYSTKNVAAGTGLGLSIISNVVDEADGTLHIDSGEKEGVKLTISLPIDD